MLKNQWYAVLEARQLKQGKMLGVTRCSEKLVFWRDEQDRIGCICDKCCHRGASISKGIQHGGNVACPFHGFQYDSSGKVRMIPANGKQNPVPPNFKVNAFLAKEAYGFIWLWYSDTMDNAPEIPFFDELKEGFHYGGFSETWAVHYTRAIENQLDVVHLPFVHATTIGKGNNALVNGPVVEWEGDRMTFYVKNEQDHGQTPQKPWEIQNKDKLFHLQFQMPNIWQNVISDKVRIVAVFAPIDEDHTHIYLRFYQNFIGIPGLRQLVGLTSNVFNRIILHQDRRVVLTQIPNKSQLVMGENLIQGDLPIIEFRKRYDEKKQK